MNSFPSLQDEIFDGIKSQFPDTTVKINSKDAVMEIRIPSLHENSGYYFVFNTKVENRQHFYFICRDKVLIDKILSEFPQFSPYFTSGIKPANTTFNSVADLVIKALIFITDIKNSIKNNADFNFNNEVKPIVVSIKPMGFEQKQASEISATDSNYFPVRYTGDLLNGQKHGLGKYCDDDGNVFEGIWIQDSFIKGRAKYKDGKIVEGDGFIDFDNNGIGKPNGRCKVLFPTGEEYYGDLVEGDFWGSGKYSYNNGDSYFGEYVLNKMNGKGNYTYSNGDVYEGDFYLNEQTGAGKFTWDNGEFIYDGEFVNGSRTGKGKEYSYNKGTIISFKEGKFNNGILVKGILSYYDQPAKPYCTMEGDFILLDNNLELHGEGKCTYFNSKGEISWCQDGDFIEGQLIGNGKITEYYNGKIAGYKEGFFLGDGTVIDDEQSTLQKKELLKTKNARVPTTKIEEPKARRSYTIEYTIRLTKSKSIQVPRGSFLGTLLGFNKMRVEEEKTHDKGQQIERKIVVQKVGKMSKSEAKEYVITKDEDIKSGKAGMTTVIINDIYECND